MEKFNVSLNIEAIDTISATKSGTYDDAIRLSQVVDDSDTPILLVTGSADKGTNSLSGCKTLMVKNSGVIGAEIKVQIDGWTAGSPDSNSGYEYLSYLLGAGDFLFLPNIKQCGYSDATSAARGQLLLDLEPSSNLYLALDSGTELGTLSDANDKTLAVTDASYYKNGDLLRLQDEIVEVTNISGTTLTVKRGMYGTTAATQSGVDVRLPFFYVYVDYDKYSVVQTDGSGKFKARNFFGYGRKADEVGDGFVAGSISGKFYSAGYQELGLSGITSSTESGLTASTAYQFTIAVDGGSAYDLDVTTSTNTKFGGSDGVIQKIQDALDAGFYASGNLFEKRVTVGIVNGDIRFTSGQRLSTSAIALGDSSGGDTDIWGVGRIPAIADVEAAVAAQLPEDVIYDNLSNSTKSNLDAMFYDDGHGNILGACTGTINYETGAIDLNGCPPNAEFVVSANYGSALAGGSEFTAALANSILSISARSVNQKINTTIDIVGLK